MMRIVAVLCSVLGMVAGCPIVAGAGDSTASHRELESIGTTPETRFESLIAFCLDRKGNLLCCDDKAGLVKVISPVGKLLATWKLPFGPTRISCANDGSVYVGGEGIMARLDQDGKVDKTIASDGRNFPKARVSGIAVTDKYVFASLGNGWSLSSKASIVRFDRDLAQPGEIARNLRGCCQRLDLAARDGVLYVAENTRYRVVAFDAEGKELSSWGKQSRTDVEGFGSCCNPMNLFFSADGEELYTAESGMGRVKRYTPDGKFLGLVGEVGVQRFTQAGRTAASCSNITIAASNDGRRVFVQDLANNIIRVLLKEGTPVQGTKAAAPDTDNASRPQPGTGRP